MMSFPILLTWKYTSTLFTEQCKVSVKLLNPKLQKLKSKKITQVSISQTEDLFKNYCSETFSDLLSKYVICQRSVKEVKKIF